MRLTVLLFCIALATSAFGQSPLSAAPTAKTVNRGDPVQHTGALVVVVTWGDVDNSPATNVIVEVVGQATSDSWGKRVLLESSKRGQYEASLDPGLYDVFVSEPGSMPRCRRVHIQSKSRTYWTLKLERDDVYQRGDVF